MGSTVTSDDLTRAGNRGAPSVTLREEREGEGEGEGGSVMSGLLSCVLVIGGLSLCLWVLFFFLLRPGTYAVVHTAGVKLASNPAPSPGLRHGESMQHRLGKGAGPWV